LSHTPPTQPQPHTTPTTIQPGESHGAGRDQTGDAHEHATKNQHTHTTITAQACHNNKQADHPGQQQHTPKHVRAPPSHGRSTRCSRPLSRSQTTTPHPTPDTTHAAGTGPGPRNHHPTTPLPLQLQKQSRREPREKRVPDSSEPQQCVHRYHDPACFHIFQDTTTRWHTNGTSR
jgi:hypothetical protein